MKASKTLRRPANWQDFETLCKKLWGEIWQCPEIQKNGRIGQTQFGVDIFGMPKDEKGYYGIQCKGKSEYNDNQYLHPQFTEEEIDNEIKAAKNFEPGLKKLYFATTALNDSKIQTFVRQKNLQQISEGFFEVHLFCWESIVDLIDENRHTLDWYLNSNSYKTLKSIDFTFHDGSTKLIGIVPFYQKVTQYKLKEVMPENQMELYARINKIMTPQIITKMNFGTYKKNHSFNKFHFRIHNTGTMPIEDFKIFLHFEGEFETIERISKGGSSYLTSNINITYNTFINNDEKEGRIIPFKKILVGDDFMNFDDLKIKPHPGESEVLIKWKLVSRDFKDEGQLKLILKPEIKKDYSIEIIEDPQLIRTEEGPIEDYITEEKGSFLYGF